MKIISLERTPKRVELLKRMGSNDKLVAAEAQEAFAAFMGPVIQNVLTRKVTSNMIYQDVEFSSNDRPTIPLELYLGTQENFVRVWSQVQPGGLPTNIFHGLSEYTFTTYTLDSAIAFQKSYVKQARLDVMTAGMDKMINEIAVKQERNAWSPILGAIATATTNGQSHIIEATHPGEFLLEDLNRLWTKIARMYTANGYTAVEGAPAGLTDLFVSPEIMEDIRAFAYNPNNTRGGFNSDGTEVGGVLGLPEAMRERIFNGGGLTEIYNVTLHSMVEFGVGQAYNTLFDNFYQGSFDPATQQLALGIDLTRPVFLRPVELDDDAGMVNNAPAGQVVVRPDDQFLIRSEKIGFFAKVREGRVILDDRAVVGIII